MRTASLLTSQLLCAALLLVGPNLIATESAPLEMPAISELKDNHLPAGGRTLLPSEYLDIKKRFAAEEAKEALKLGTSADMKMSLERQDYSAAADVKAAVTIGSVYYSTHPGANHAVVARGVYGETLQLEDGAIWNIHPGDSYKVLNWLMTDTIIILPNHAWFSSYGYCIVNLNTGVSVEASIGFYLNPVYHTQFNHRIVAIDDVRKLVWLEDGSKWSLLSVDYNPFHWQINDTVIIGINDGFYYDTYPNILINAVNLIHARTSCLSY